MLEKFITQKYNHYFILSIFLLLISYGVITDIHASYQTLSYSAPTSSAFNTALLNPSQATNHLFGVAPKLIQASEIDASIIGILADSSTHARVLMQTQGQQRWLQVGDAIIPGAMITEIKSNYVIFSYQDKLEKIKFNQANLLLDQPIKKELFND